MANIFAPIWQDVKVTIGADSPTAFEIWKVESDGSSILIYSGIAQPHPLTGDVEVIPNDICANYLSQLFPIESSNGIYTNFYPAPIKSTFEIRREEGEVVESIEFLYDWSYDPNSEGYENVRNVSMLIDRKVTPDMSVILTDYGTNDEIELTCVGRVEEEIYNSYSKPEEAGNFVLNVQDVLSFYGNTVYFGIDRQLDYYHIIEGCTKYALFYVNAFGGWDVLRLISGTETNNYERSTFKQKHLKERLGEVDATDLRGTTNYLNQVTRQWSFGTDWLTDEGAKNISHLIGSTNVWLHNIEQGEILPVTIIDTTAEVKNFRNQGAQLVRYDINVQLAQDRLRR